MNPQQPTSFERIPTGIEGLDLLLNGGFLKGGVYLIMGAPGTGKTIIANQLAFNRVAAGGRALYVTLLAETHARMFGNLRQLSFFDDNQVSDRINYLGAYSVLEREGLEGLLKMLSEAIRKFKADMLFIDGVASIEDIAATSLSFKKFVHQLNSVLSISGCTTFLLSSMDTSQSNPEHTMVDGIVSLTHAERGQRDLRQVEIRKFRGSNHLKGRHLMMITEQGIQVFPRLESILAKPAADLPAPTARRPFGSKALDEMLGGGVLSGTTTSLLGPAGSGKTTLGSQFLVAGAERGEKGLYFGFYEAPHRLARKMQGLGLPLQKYLENGMIRAIWQAETEHYLDDVLDHLLRTVREQKIRRVFIDGVGGIREGMFEKKRLHRALTALSNTLRSMDVTTMLTEETEIFAAEVSAPISDLSAVTDNVFFLRQTEVDSELRRLFSIIKTRDFDAEHILHEFKMGPGIQLGNAFKNLEALMKGSPAQVRGQKVSDKNTATRSKGRKGSTRKKK